jgi:hypothetical protein
MDILLGIVVFAVCVGFAWPSIRRAWTGYADTRFEQERDGDDAAGPQD